ncbi:hypothetical protein Tco_1528645 [Tanacetum coccineum]
MESESTSSKTQYLTPSFKVSFTYSDSIIAFNNSIALLDHPNALYHPMLSFLSNCYIGSALTKQPSATAEVDDATKAISFSLSSFENKLSFTREDFISAIGLTNSESFVSLPIKETIRAGLATLGLVDKDKPSLSSTDLCLGGILGSHDQLNLNQQTIAYCLIFSLKVNIGDIIFNDLVHKLQNWKKNRETNICYTKFLSLTFENFLGDNYNDDDLIVLKPNSISATSFQTPMASEVRLTSHMLRVAKISTEPEKSLVLPSEEVNADETADKSSSGTNM